MDKLKEALDKFIQSLSSKMGNYEQEKKIPFQTIWCNKLKLTFRLTKN